MVVSGDGKKYDLLPLDFFGCVKAWQEVRYVASSFGVLWGHGKKYDLLPLVFLVVSGHGKKVRFVASSFCGSVGAWQEV